MSYDADDSAIDLLGATWRAADLPIPTLDAIPERLETRIRAGTRRMILAIIGEVLLTLAVFAGVAVGIGGPSDKRTSIAWALATIHTAVVWGFVIWNRRGLWQPNAVDTGAYLALARRRALRRLDTARFTIGLVYAEATVGALVLAMLPGSFATAIGRYWWPATFGVVFGVTVALAAGRLRRTARRELEWVDRLEAELA
jgi:hypothetical protein